MTTLISIDICFVFGTQRKVPERYVTVWLLQIERIENHMLYQQYSIAKSHMMKVNGSGTSVERRLWHGTSVDALVNIYAGGFNRSYCGKNGELKPSAATSFLCLVYC
jgi:hypothetical protein